MEYDTVYDITDSQDTSGEKIEQEENESGITIEEAGNMIDSFLKETGFSSIPQTESSQLKWSGYNERADQVYQEDDIYLRYFIKEMLREIRRALDWDWHCARELRNFTTQSFVWKAACRRAVFFLYNSLTTL